MDKIRSLEKQIQTRTDVPHTATTKNLKRLNQQITKVEKQRYRRMHKLEITSPTAKKARTRSLVQIGSLCEKSGVLKSFGIILDKNLQKDPEMQEPASDLFKEFVRLSDAKSNLEGIS
ncbi:MAG: hypothetical protein MRY83_05340 [Flavobacteriales bacterium]|nr:hypothetical protein [Flavobacteriales bacterium]